MNKSFIFIGVVLFLLGAVFLSKSSFLGDKNADQSKQKVTIMMPFIQQIQWAPFYAALVNGYYDEEGLDVTIEYSTRGSAGPLEQLTAGNIQVALTTAESVVLAKSKGMDLVAVYTLEPINVFYIVSDKKHSIQSVKDLKGKKVGLISSASGAYGNVLTMLAKENMSINDIEVIQAGTSVVPSFLEGQFEAAAIHLSQKLLIEERGIPLNVINAADYSNISSGHIVVTNEFAKQNPELVKKFLRATQRGLESATKEPEKVVDAHIQLYPEAASNRDVSLKLWKAFITTHGYAKAINGREEVGDWNTTQDILMQAKVQEKKIDITEIISNDFLPN